MQFRKPAAVVAALGALGAAAAPAQAATDNTSIAIGAGSLTYPTPLAAANFPAVTLNGLQQTVRTSISPFVVNDARGFFTSRVIGAFLDEAVAALGEGIHPVFGATRADPAANSSIRCPA